MALRGPNRVNKCKDQTNQRPNKPKSAYVLFVQKYSNILEAAQEWAKLSKQDRQKYQVEAAQDRRFKMEMDKYQQIMDIRAKSIYY